MNRDDAGAVAAHGPSLPRGTRVDAYQIDAVIAVGGCGTVYRAYHLVENRPVALKVLHAALASSADARLRFEREAQAMNTVGHPNIVDIQEFSELPDGRPYFVMELLEGEDLEATLAYAGSAATGRGGRDSQPAM